MLIQGTTVIRSARRLGLVDEESIDEDDFGVELADELPTSLHTIVLTERHLADGNTLRDMSLPEGSLVMMIKRGDRYMVPNGTRRLFVGDKLLVITEDSSAG